jgi:hypothetical protein
MNVTKWNAEDFTYLKQKFPRISDKKITGRNLLQPSRKNLRNGRKFDDILEEMEKPVRETLKLALDNCLGSHKATKYIRLFG